MGQDAGDEGDLQRPGLGREQGIMTLAGGGMELFRSGCRVKEGPAKSEGNGPVFFAVKDEKRRGHIADAVDRAVLVQHQQAHRQPGVGRGGNIGGGGIGRLQQQRADAAVGSQPHGNAGAKRFAHHGKAVRCDTLRQIRAIGNDLAMDPGIGNCGKAGQWVPVGVGQPTLLIGGLTVGGQAIGPAAGKAAA